ncbi:MAG: hypothetical protein ACXWCS_29055 [Burkholderiales bacterium]
MSQSGLNVTGRDQEWDRWYFDHLNIMVSVRGISSAQRFKTSTHGYSPSLAMYSIASADVFKDSYYLSVRGMGEWLTLIDKQYYRRNLFAGLDNAPDVADSEVLIVADREQPDPVVDGILWTWLQCVGLDRSTNYRGVAVVPLEIADKVRSLKVAAYRPVTRPYKR